MPVPKRKPRNPFSNPRPGEDARTVAWLALRRAAGPRATDAQEILGQLAQMAQLDPRDRALAFEMMQGVWRTRALLDAAMDRIEGFAGKTVTPDVRDLMRIGAYQHFYMDRVPCHALVHATVEVARLRLGGRKAGFCNAFLQRILLQYPARGADLEKLARGLPIAERFSMPDWIVRLVGRAVGQEKPESDPSDPADLSDPSDPSDRSAGSSKPASQKKPQAAGEEKRESHPSDPSDPADPSDPSILLAALAALNRPLPLYARCNPALVAAEEAVRELARAGIRSRFRPELAPLCIEVECAAGLLAQTEVFLKGGLFIQDASSQLVAELAGARLRSPAGLRPSVRPGSSARREWTVLDYCAAPGGKATYLAALMEGKGRLIAHEISAARQARLRENIARLGFEGFIEVAGGEGEIRGTHPPTKTGSPDQSDQSDQSDRSDGSYASDPSDPSDPSDRSDRSSAKPAPHSFPKPPPHTLPKPPPHSLPKADLALVDAPCSGLGTLRRHPEIRWRINYSDVRRLAHLQKGILDQAAQLVRPGGWLVYSTCSLAPEENQEVVEAFLKARGGRFRIVRDTLGLPDCLTTRMDGAGWLRLLPHRDEMDSACAVRMVNEE